MGQRLTCLSAVSSYAAKRQCTLPTPLDKKSSPFHQAVREGDICTLLPLLDKDPEKINECDAWGLSPLHLAAEAGNVDMVNLLIGLGADLDRPTLDPPVGLGHGTPLIFAANHGWSDCVESLLKAGATPDLPDRWGNTPLMKACSYGAVESVRLLIEAGADPNLQNLHGAMALIKAVSIGHVEITSLLLQAGANINLIGKTHVLLGLGSKPSQSAKHYLGYKNGYCFNSHKWSTDSDPNALYFAVSHVQIKCASKLLEEGSMVTPEILSRIGLICCDIYGNHYRHNNSIKLDSDLYLLISVILQGITNTKHMEEGVQQMLSTALTAQKLCLVELIMNVLPTLKTIDIVQKLLDKNPVDEETEKQLKSFIKTPRTLKTMCASAIRESLHENTVSSSKRLPLPKLLQKDLCTLISCDVRSCMH